MKKISIWRILSKEKHKNNTVIMYHLTIISKKIVPQINHLRYSLLIFFKMEDLDFPNVKQLWVLTTCSQEIKIIIHFKKKQN